MQNSRIVHDRTGVLYQIGDHHFILTASHAGENGDQNLRDVIQNEIPLYVPVNADGVLPIPLCGANFHGTEVNGRDIAVIRLPNDVASQIALHKRFILHNAVRVDDNERTGGYVIVGFPMDWSCQKLGEDYLYSDPLIYYCKRYMGEVDPQSAYSPEVHVLLGFERNARNVTIGQDEQIPLPSGISGCGVWRVADPWRRELQAVSSANVSLVGVQNKWHRGLNYIMATRISWVLQCILHGYPELERPMRLAYPKNVSSGRIMVAQLFGNWVPHLGSAGR
ncbi:MAG: hypothetical protein AABZ12_02815 [Planctomycetota bacterium]